MIESSPEQAQSPGVTLEGAMPMTGYSAGDIPADFLVYAPERDGKPCSLLVVHPPFATMMRVIPEEMLSEVILPALERYQQLSVGRDTKYVIDSAQTPDGLYLLWITEAPE